MSLEKFVRAGVAAQQAVDALLERRYECTCGYCSAVIPKQSASTWAPSIECPNCRGVAVLGPAKRKARDVLELVDQARNLLVKASEVNEAIGGTGMVSFTLDATADELTGLLNVLRRQ